MRTFAVRVRVLAAGLTLVAAGCMVLGWGSRSRQLSANARPAAQPPATLAGFLNASLTPPPSSFNQSSISRHAPSNASSLFGGLPLIFEPNQGQAGLEPDDARVRFLAHGSGYSLALGSRGAIISLQSARGKFESLPMNLEGANSQASVSGAELLPGKSNYLLGSDPAKWRQNIPQFARVRYDNVYPGINLVFYGREGHLEYDFQVAAGADPSLAVLDFGNATAAAQKDGSILIKIKRNGAAMRLEAPRVYQEIAGREQTIEGRFILRGAHRAGFAIGAYDRSRELIIDPVLTFSTYFGGSGDEHASSVAVDGGGNVYLAGSTNSINLPVIASVPPVVQPTLNATPGARNVYIAKINPSTNPVSLVYVTYLGGSGTDSPVGVAVDGASDVFVAGTTSSINFPTTPGAYQTPAKLENPGAAHVFVTELNPTATALQYSSYLSGNGIDLASGMTIDSAGDIFVTGTTTSSDEGVNGSQFPTSTLPFASPFQSHFFPPIQFFVTKVNTSSTSSSSIAYSTYFGGANTAGGAAPIATGGGIAVDTNGNVYFDGTTNFTYTNGAAGDFPILNAYQPCLNQPPPLVVVNPPVCSNLSSATTDAFLAKLNINPSIPQGDQLQWSSFFGGAANDSGNGIAVDIAATNVFITGTTNSPGISGTSNFAAFQVCLDTPVNPPSGTACSTTVTANDAYVARLSNPALNATANNMVLNYFSYLGGTGDEEGLAITVDPSDNAYLTGSTTSSGAAATAFPVFPSPSDLQGQLAGARDSFIARLNTTTTNGQNQTGAFTSYFGGALTSAAGPATTLGTGVALDTFENIYFAGETNANDLQLNKPLPPTQGGSYNGGVDAFVAELGGASTIGLTGVLTVGTNQTFIAAGNPATFTYTISNNGPDPATNLTFSDDLQNSPVTLTFGSASSTAGTCTGGGTNTVVTCTIPTLAVGGTVNVVVVATPTASQNGAELPFNGGAAQVTGPNDISSPRILVPAQMSDFTVNVNPPSNSVNVAGGTAQYQVKLTPNPVYGTNIALSCTGLPNASSCAFAPGNSISLPSTSPGAATLNITTTARPINTGSAKSRFGNFYAAWIVVPAFALLGMGATTNRRRRRLLGFLMLCALFVQVLLLPACSGTTTQAPTPGTQAGTYNITVSATSGSDTKSQGITLTVP